LIPLDNYEKTYTLFYIYKAVKGDLITSIKIIKKNTICLK